MDYPALDRLEALVGGLTQMGNDLTAKLAEFSEALVEGTSDSEKVVVVSRPDGRIVNVRLNPRAMRMGSEELAEEFRQAATRAQEAAAAAAKEQIRTLLSPLPRQESPSDADDDRWDDGRSTGSQAGRDREDRGERRPFGYGH